MGIALGGGIYDLSAAEVAQRFDQLAAAGFQWVRLDMNWAFLEPTPGTYAWGETDALVNAAAARGLQVLGLIAYTPSWARPPGTDDKHQPNNTTDFAAFAGAAARRYRGQIVAWEIWNEPNHLPFWSSGPDAAFYGDLVTASAFAIRVEAPGSFIISGGLSPAVDGSGSIAPETFMRGFLDRVPAGTLNAVGIHPYSFPALPDEPLAWNTFARMPQMQSLIAGYDPNLILWPTEFGAPVAEVGEVAQADAIRRAVECSEKHSWIGPMFIFTLQDLGGDTFGIRDGAGNERPAWTEVERLTDGFYATSSCRF